LLIEIILADTKSSGADMNVQATIELAI